MPCSRCSAFRRRTTTTPSGPCAADCASSKAAAELSWPDGDPVQVRIGVNTGETYLHTDVDPASGETFLTGDAVNTAARLETAARPAASWSASSPTVSPSHAIAYQRARPTRAQGQEAAGRAWLAVEPKARTGLRTSGEADTPFLGRGARARGTCRMPSRPRPPHKQGPVSSSSSASPASARAASCSSSPAHLEERPELVTWRQGRCLAFGDEAGFAALSDVVKAHAGILDSDDVATVEAKLEACSTRGRGPSLAAPAPASPARPRSRHAPPKRRTSSLGLASSRIVACGTSRRHRHRGPALGRRGDARPSSSICWPRTSRPRCSSSPRPVPSFWSSMWVSLRPRDAP